MLLVTSNRSEAADDRKDLLLLSLGAYIQSSVICCKQHFLVSSHCSKIFTLGRDIVLTMSGMLDG